MTITYCQQIEQTVERFPIFTQKMILSGAELQRGIFAGIVRFAALRPTHCQDAIGLLRRNVNRVHNMNIPGHAILTGKKLHDCVILMSFFTIIEDSFGM